MVETTLPSPPAAVVGLEEQTIGPAPVGSLTGPAVCLVKVCSLYMIHMYVYVLIFIYTHTHICIKIYIYNKLIIIYTNDGINIIIVLASWFPIYVGI